MASLEAIEQFWSEQADRFDDEPDHGLADASVREAWSALLGGLLPPGELDVADLGCGTGSLSLLLAEQGHRVTGIDLSPRMIGRAEEKRAASDLEATFLVGDAGAPELPATSFDAVLCRHVLWTLPSPLDALGRWVRILRPGGRLVAVEGRWFEPRAGEERGLPWDGGVGAAELIDAVTPLFERVEHLRLTSDDALWGKQVDDERYAVVAVKPR